MADTIQVNTLSGFNRIIAATPKVVILFTSPSWCVPCQRLKPHYEAVAKEAAEYVFLWIDVDNVDKQFSEAIAELGIRSVPTVHLYLDGEFSREIKGRTALAILKELP